MHAQHAISVDGFSIGDHVHTTDTHRKGVIVWLVESMHVARVRFENGDERLWSLHLLAHGTRTTR